MKALVAAAVVLGAATQTAHAFCGFYVAGGDQQMFNDATQVVLMRDGTRTALSMQNNYKGPPDAFAMVIPVPVVLHEGDVKTLPKDVFAHVEQMGAPRLVEYWEQDPCRVMLEDRNLELVRAPATPSPVRHESARGDLGVTIEAKFVVGEYQIVILSAKDSTGLDTWLRQEKYNIPPGAEPLLRPYVENGSKFFVAKVDPAKVTFVDGRAALSPLRFHYDDDRFELPIRLGLANSSGTQDLIVNILAPDQRYEVANYPDVTIPTNLDVKDSVKDRFGAFYTALFDATLEKNPGAVVTEYAWQATTCDPCPGPTLGPADFQLLGADVVAKPQAYPNWVLTRLHMRYGKDLKDDLEFRAAEPIVGGREHVVDPATGRIENGARADSYNNFQGRYIIRHPWTGAVTCQDPHWHVWGGPPNGAYNGPISATGLAFAPRGQVKLPAVVNSDVPELGIVAGKAPPPRGPETAPAYAPTKTTGCQTGDPAGLACGLALIGLAFSRSRRRGARQEP